MINFWLLLSLLFGEVVSVDEVSKSSRVKEMTFFDLCKMRENESEIIISGFLVCDGQNCTYLSPQPNVKSCCIGKGEQLLLQNFSCDEKQNSLVKIQGNLNYDLKTSRYLIKNPQLIVEKQNRLTVYFFIFGAAIFAVVFILKRL